MDRRDIQNISRVTGPESSTVKGGATPGEPVFISRSPAIADILRVIDLVAPSSAPVLVTGESGTGKEIVARLVHVRSGRPVNPLVAINCAALPKDVIDNELFGHEREAFTGAASRRPGCFERAHGGSLFLDELTEMHPQVQAKLLRALESKTIRRLGGHEDIEVNVRIIAATNRRMSEALESGALRADLYFRLSVVEIHLPPLRDRKCDIPLLAGYFLRLLCEKHERQIKKLSVESMEMLAAYHWPGNVRELRNMVESIVLLCPGETVSPKFLPVKISHASPSRISFPTMEAITIPFGTSLYDAERQLILLTLSMAGNNKSRAARILGLSRKAMYDKLRQYAPEREAGPGDA